MAIPALVPESLSYLDLLAIQEHIMKTCTACGVNPSAFTQDLCDQCNAKIKKSIYDKKRYSENAEKFRAYQKQYKANNPNLKKQQQNVC